MIKKSANRLAWAVLLGSFFICVALAVGVPTLGISLVNNLTRSTSIIIKLQAGKVGASDERPGSTVLVDVGLDGFPINEGARIVVGDDSQSQGTLIISDEINSPPYAQVQLYSGAKVRILRARAPRFGASNQPIDIDLYLQSGRIQVQRHASDQAVRVRVHTGQLASELEVGTYSFEVNDDPINTETSLVVRDGAAHTLMLNADGNDLKSSLAQVTSNQRVIARKGEQQLQTVAAARNILRNGDWSGEIDRSWETVVKTAVQGEMVGAISVLTSDGKNSLLIDRRGSNLNWGRTGLIQQLNENVADRSSVQVRVDFAIFFQNLPVCGGRGSECPLMIKIVYRDKQGSDREWIQGFYADGTPQAGVYPDEILDQGEPRLKHIKTPLGTRVRQESSNLLQTNKDMQLIKSISVYAEGHAVQAQVYSIELLVAD